MWFDEVAFSPGDVVLGIRPELQDELDHGEDLYRRFTVEMSGFMIANGAGTATARVDDTRTDCLAYEVDVRGTTYLVLLRNELGSGDSEKCRETAHG